jgi:arsenate reductase (thioredoxin)
MKSYNILFLCTGNSARSILGEVIATSISNGKFTGYSAGSMPNGIVNPYAIEIAKAYNYDLAKLKSKSWDEYALPNAPHMDFIITVCDNAAGEVCPYWPGKPATAHWGYPDPAAVEGSDEEKHAAFMAVEIGLRKRIEILMNLPLESLEHMAIHEAINNMGNLD